MNIYRRLKKLLNKKQKRTVLVMMVLIFFSALLETLSVGIIIPLISAIVNPEEIMEQGLVKEAFAILNIAPDPDSFVRILLAATMAIFFLKTLYLLLIYRLQAGFATRTECSISVRLMSDYMNRPYSFYLNADVNAIFQNFNKDIPHVFELIQEVMKLVTEIAVSICMCAFLLVIDVKMTLSIAALLFVMVLVIILFVKPTLGRLGQKRMDMQVASMKWMQQGVFGIKDVKVSRKEGYFLNRFSEAYGGLTASKRSYAVLNNTPRLVIETVCIVGMLGYMLIKVVSGGDLNSLLPQLTAFGGAAIRLMPSVNRISTYLSSIAYFEPSLDYVCDHLDLASLEDVKIPEEGKPLPLSGEILLKDIRFRYPGTEKDIFEHADMRIPVGSSVGVVGASGAGKTTVIDILLGLLSPQEGSLVVNGEKLRGDDPRWLASIGYIAQNIYMLDDTIRANVAFGVPDAEVDEARIREVLKEAQLEEFIDTLPEGLDAVIGDRGVRISGGQRQRIGIARALYHDPELLVFDEATSALDNDTEAAIMEAINALKGRKTMVIIAHRLKTIENCDIVYRVENGQITEEPRPQAG